MDPNRQVRLSGALNFREIGGLSVQNGGVMKSGLLYRSDELSRLTRQDGEKCSAWG